MENTSIKRAKPVQDGRRQHRGGDAAEVLTILTEMSCPALRTLDQLQPQRAVAVAAAVRQDRRFRQRLAAIDQLW